MTDYADATAQSMALLAGPSGKLKASNEEVSATTERYAANLKLISDLTGQDAKAKAEKVRQDNDTLAFNSYMNGLSQKQREATKLAMDAMSDGDARAFREKKIYGNVISTDLATARAINSGIRKAQDDMFENVGKAGTGAKEVFEIYNQYKEEAISESNKAGKSLGLARDGSAVDAAKIMQAQTQHMAHVGDAAEAAANIQKLQQDAKSRKGGLENTIAETTQQLELARARLAADNVGMLVDQINGTISALKGMEEAFLHPLSIWDAIKKTITDDWKIIAVGIAGVAGTALAAMAGVGLKRIIFGGGSKVKDLAGGEGGSGKVAGGLGKGLEGLGKGIGSIGAGAGKAISSLLSGLATGLKEIGSGKALLGAGVLVVLGGAMFVMGKAIKSFAELNWDAVGKSLLTIGALATMAGIMGIGPIAAAIGIGTLLLAGMAVSIGLLGAALKGFPANALEPMFDMFKEFGKTISNVFNGAWDMVKGFYKDVVDGASDLIGNVVGWFDGIGTKISKAFNEVWGTVKGFFSKLGDLGKHAWDWISDGLSSAFGSVGKVIMEIYHSIIDKLSDKLLSISKMAPVSWFTSSGAPTPESSAQPKTIQQSIPNASTALAPAQSQSNEKSVDSANPTQNKAKSESAENEKNHISHSKNMLTGIDTLTDIIRDQKELIQSLLSATNDSNAYLRKITSHTA